MEGRGRVGPYSQKKRVETIRIRTIPFRKQQVIISSSLLFHLNVPMKMQQVEGPG